MAGRPAANRQEKEDWYYRLLHGWSDRHAHSCGCAERVGAGATFHGGGLVTQKPDSPLAYTENESPVSGLSLPRTMTRKNPKPMNVLKESFAGAGLPAEIEVYKAGHGWCPPDTKVYNQELSEKAWARLLVLFEKALV